MGAEGFPSLEFSGILPEGLSGPAPTGGILSCAGKKVTKEVARGPLPAPWTPGAVVPDLQPLLAFSLERSSRLSAAWVDTRLPPPFGCCAAEGMGFGVGSPTEGGSGRIEPLRRCAPPPLSKGRLRGVGAGPSVSAHQPPPRKGTWPQSFHQPASPLGGRVGRGVHLISPRREF